MNSNTFSLSLYVASSRLRGRLNSRSGCIPPTNSRLHALAVSAAQARERNPLTGERREAYQDRLFLSKSSTVRSDSDLPLRAPAQRGSAAQQRRRRLAPAARRERGDTHLRMRRIAAVVGAGGAGLAALAEAAHNSR